MLLTESHRLPLHQVYGNSRFYLDYLAGRADRYFTHPAGTVGGAVRARDAADAASGDRRRQLADALTAYNRALGAPAAAREAAAALADPDCCCVHTGQQAGLMGGPVYTLYKIASAIRLAARYQEQLGRRCVPVFWLASEDHDLGEINHAHYLAGDGSIGRVRFAWEGEGRSISDLPVTPEVANAAAEFFRRQPTGEFVSYARELFTPRGSGFAQALAAAFARLFGDHGLVLMEPHLLRPLFPGFFRRAVAAGPEVQAILARAAQALAADGYPVPLAPERAGTLFQYVDGQRVRLAAGEQPPAAAMLSTDATLRPVLADLALPSVATVLGPGEVAYQAMLRGIYQLFGVPQPLVVPRQSYTVVPAAAAATLTQFDLVPTQIVGPEFSVSAAFNAAVPAGERARFAYLRGELHDLWAPLERQVTATDPNLAHTWRRSLGHAERAVDRLEERATRALMSRRGAGRGELQRLRDLVWPRGRPQERVLPAAHFLARYGPAFVPALLAACDPELREHEILMYAAGGEPAPAHQSTAAACE